MNDIDNLRPEVRQAIELLDRVPNNAWAIVRTDYARLLRRNAELEAYADDMASQASMGANVRAEKAEADLAALKARIAEAPTLVYGRDDWRNESLIGKRVALVPVED